MEFPRKMANREIEFFNFLKKYDLDHYHERLKQEGISKINHLQHVKGEDLERVGMSKPEQKRLLGKYEQHFSKFGKFKVRLHPCQIMLLCCGSNYLYTYKHPRTIWPP